MPMAARGWLFAATLLLVATGCTVVTGKDDADAVAQQLFLALNQKNWDHALTFYDSRFFQQVTREEWRATLPRLNDKLGDLQSWELVGWRAQKTVGTALSGTVYEMGYRLTYSKHPADARVVLYRPLTGGELRVIGHHINSAGLLN